jgi:predicted transcriptional regulator
MPLAFKRVFENLMGERAPGPSASFSLFHVLLALELIAEKPVGRSKMAEELNIGEGAVRTMLNRLRESGLIVTSKAGYSLTNKGGKLWEECQSVLRKAEIEENELALGEYSFAVLVKNSLHKVRSGVEQRDAAVKAGAKGATTVILKDRRLTIPSVSNNVAVDFPKAARQISERLQPQESDVIVIASADNRKRAEYSALAAGWTLLDD